MALKCLSKERMENGTQEFLKEAAIMQTIDHENICAMFGVVIDKDDTLILVGVIKVIKVLVDISITSVISLEDDNKSFETLFQLS